jgi:hypothetical protein
MPVPLVAACGRYLPGADAAKKAALQRAFPDDKNDLAQPLTPYRIFPIDFPESLPYSPICHISKWGLNWVVKRDADEKQAVAKTSSPFPKTSR